MARLIDADKLQSQLLIRIDHCDKEHGNEKFVMGIEYAMEYVDEMPTVDAVPAVEVQHGKWEFAGYTAFHGTPYKSCSLCKKVYLMEYPEFNYCPNCGAKMDGDVNNG